MPNVSLPLSGDVSQIFKFWSGVFNMMGNQFGLIINLGNSSNPKVEEEVLAEIGSYGRQLGRMQEAVAVLLAHLPADTKLSEPEKAALADFKQMFNNIADVKCRHGDDGDEVLYFKDNPSSKLAVKS